MAIGVTDHSQMSRPNPVSASEAAALLRPEDRLTIPLGPGQPKAFSHALGERNDWTELTVLGALLVDLFAVFAHPEDRAPVIAAATEIEGVGDCGNDVGPNSMHWVSGVA